MKAILVIDMPKACADGCPVMCRARGINHRPTWCPLRPMPLKGTMENVDECEYNRGFVDGRNHCIELITGETE